MNKIKLAISDSVADTLFITLSARAEQSAAKNGLLYDPTACTLVEQIDYDFSKYKNKKTSTVGVALRATYFDQQCIDFIASTTKPVLVFLGCGLDTRFLRINAATSKAIVYEIDLPEVIAARQQLLPAAKNQHYIGASMFDKAWMQQLAQQHPDGDFLFVIEGVLMYFEKQKCRQFFIDLANNFKTAELYFDVLNVWMSKNSAIHDTVKNSQAVFKFGIDDDLEIASWHPRLEHVETRLFNSFKGWRQMGFLISSLMSILPAFKNASRLLHYKIVKNAA